MNPKVSIIIVNYNSQQTIGRCIDSVYKYVSGIKYEIIVVDNASAPASVRFIKKNYPDVILLENSENKGFGTANNRGTKHASGDYLFFLNPDTVLLNNAVLGFYNFLEKEKPEAVSCGGNLVKQDGSPTVAYGNFPTVFQEWSLMGFHRFYQKHYDEHLRIGKTCSNLTIPQKVPFIVGADIFIKKDIFWKIGGFDENFFLYYEETDLFYRLHRKGYHSYILPQVKIIHLEGPSLLKNGKLNLEKWAFWEESKYYYFRKNRGLFAMLFVKKLQIFSLILHRFFGAKAYPLRKALKITWNA